MNAIAYLAAANANYEILIIFTTNSLEISLNNIIHNWQDFLFTSNFKLLCCCCALFLFSSAHGCLRDTNSLRMLTCSVVLFLYYQQMKVVKKGFQNSGLNSGFSFLCNVSNTPFTFLSCFQEYFIPLHWKTTQSKVALVLCLGSKHWIWEWDNFTDDMQLQEPGTPSLTQSSSLTQKPQSTLLPSARAQKVEHHIYSLMNIGQLWRAPAHLHLLWGRETKETPTDNNRDYYPWNPSEKQICSPLFTERWCSHWTSRSHQEKSIGL